MKLFPRSLLPIIVLGSLTVMVVSGCKPSQDDTPPQATAPIVNPLLAQPAAGDLWAVELSHFSDSDFGGELGDAFQKAYGLMKVTQVTPGQVALITEDAAWPQRDGALTDLRGDQSNISWDTSEGINVERGELAKLLKDGKILEVRRLTVN